MYVYIKTTEGLWTVGFYDPKGEFIPEEWIFKSQEAASQRVHWLNGGN